jgi:hypothetical protein
MNIEAFACYVYTHGYEWEDNTDITVTRMIGNYLCYFCLSDATGCYKSHNTAAPMCDTCYDEFSLLLLDLERDSQV